MLLFCSPQKTADNSPAHESQAQSPMVCVLGRSICSDFLMLTLSARVAVLCTEMIRPLPKMRLPDQADHTRQECIDTAEAYHPGLASHAHHPAG